MPHSPLSSRKRFRRLHPKATKVARRPRPFRLAHISDLHVGEDSAHDFAAASLADALVHADVDCIALTGDVTNTGALHELQLFWQLFGPLRQKLFVVPGNHDRGTDNAGLSFMVNAAAAADVGPLRLICLDSTQPGNEVMVFAWGGLEHAQVEFAATAARAPLLPVVLLHHHVLPAEAGEDVLAALSDAAKLPFLRQADNGRLLLARLPGRALVLHGHRHMPTEKQLPNGVRVYNAGSTTELGRFRLFEVSEAGVSVSWVASPTRWTPAAQAAMSAAPQ